MPISSVLEQKVAMLERHKRRSERLLLLTRKLMKPGPMKSAAGRPRKPKRSSTTPGRKPSRASKPKALATSTSTSSSPSTPTPGGEGAR